MFTTNRPGVFFEEVSEKKRQRGEGFPGSEFYKAVRNEENDEPEKNPHFIKVRLRLGE